jgi:hypothetical protein
MIVGWLFWCGIAYPYHVIGGWEQLQSDLSDQYKRHQRRKKQKWNRRDD